MMINQDRLFVAAAILVVMLTATWLRLYRLAEVPPGMWFDEAYNVLDAAQTLQTNTWPIFFTGNNGREPLFIYLLGLAGVMFGERPFTLRLVSAFTGLLTVPLLYCLTVSLFREFPWRYWLGVCASAGLTTSYWHVSVSRLGLRAILFVPFLIASLLFFVWGLQTERIRYFVAAGVALGLSQYTYLAARLVPLVFILFGLLWFLLLSRQQQTKVKLIWRGIVAVGLVSVLVFLPLGYFFWQQPATFFARTGDIALSGVQTTALGYAAHVVDSLRLFIDGAGTRWRYSLLTRPLLDWVGAMGFWLGVLALLSFYRRPVALLLSSGLVVMWLPGLLSQEPVHDLRQIGVLPFYYIIAAVGFMSIGRWSNRLLQTLSPTRVGGIIAVALPLLLSGLLTVQDYFYNWSSHPEVYAESRGATLDIARRALELSGSAIVLLPFETYAYPSSRVVLHERFREAILDSKKIIQELDQGTPVILLGTADAWPPRSGLVWLVENMSEQGVAYISHLLPQVPLEGVPQSVLNANTKEIGYQQSLNSVALRRMLSAAGSAEKISAQFGDTLQLDGYRLTPAQIESGQFTVLDLYWRGLNTNELGGNVFVQLVDTRGTPVAQFHEAPFSSHDSRWHWNVLIPGRHLIWTGSDLPAGQYEIQVGLFKPGTGQRFSAAIDGQPALGDQVSLGMLTVSDD